MCARYIAPLSWIKNPTATSNILGCDMHCSLFISINSGARYHRVTTYLVIGPRPRCGQNLVTWSMVDLTKMSTSYFRIMHLYSNYNHLQYRLNNYVQWSSFYIAVCLKRSQRFPRATAGSAEPIRSPWFWILPCLHCHAPEYCEASGHDACSLDLSTVPPFDSTANLELKCLKYNYIK